MIIHDVTYSEHLLTDDECNISTKFDPSGVWSRLLGGLPLTSKESLEKG